MKLIKQKTLYFSEGKSDKVYEVDLCESQGLFVVNFRYGRRGSNLREGTKTVFPVKLEEAETIFTKLVDSKVKKGYVENTEVENQASAPKGEYSIAQKTILKYLEQAVNGQYTRDWKVSKIIARAGKLNIQEAVPFIAHFILSEDEFEQHNAIISLCELKASGYAQKILEVFKNQGFSTISGRASCGYILKYGADLHKKEIQNALLKLTPKADVVTLATQFINLKQVDPFLLYYTYIQGLQNQEILPVLYTILDKIPLKPNIFKSIRYIYRLSALLEDYTFFALLSKSIGISNPFYTSDYAIIDNNWIDTTEEKQKENPAVAFSDKTKRYFTKTSYQKIYVLSQDNTSEYIELAKNLLCSLNEESDQAKAVVKYDYNYIDGVYKTEKRTFPKYHTFLALMYVLYGNTNRGVINKNQWFYVTEDLTNASMREEALPEVWDKHPEAVFSILGQAKSEIAIQFALGIISHQEDWSAYISKDVMKKLVRHKSNRVKTFILDIIRQKYASSTPGLDIVLLLLNAKQEESVALGLNWIQLFKDTYLKEENFITSLLLTGETKVIDYIKALFQESSPIHYKIQIDHLSSLFVESNTWDDDYLLAVNALISETYFKDVLERITEGEIQELVNSKSDFNKLFAVQLAFNNPDKVYEWFKNTFEAYIESETDFLRSAGIKLMAYFPDHYLLSNKKQIVKYCFSEFKEVREAIGDTIDRLVKLDRNITDDLMYNALNRILEPENYEGVHESYYHLLIKLTDGKKLDYSVIKQLVLSKYEHAQKIGTLLFENQIDLSQLSMDELVALGGSDVQTIRKQLQVYLNKNKARVNLELEDALLIFNSDWEDITQWACTFFKDHIDRESWNLEMLLYVCDHIKEEVQHLGRYLITVHFSDERGLPLLIKLQEHPNKNMQFFVTNYLEAYAKDNVEVILKLEAYFTTSMFNINTHRATKTRIYAFLEQELLKNKEVALMTVRIIKKVIDIKTLKDKNKNLVLLLTIAEVYPEIENPLTIKNTFG